VLYPQCQRGSNGCGRGNADCDFQPCRRQKRTESGLSEGECEFKSFTIIVARNRTRSRLFRWAGKANLKLDPELTHSMEQGFPDADDAFDATLGLFGMLKVLRGERKADDPNEENVRKMEGWILGQESRSSRNERSRENLSKESGKNRLDFED